MALLRQIKHRIDSIQANKTDVQNQLLAFALLSDL
jgi:hypothetical protein